MLKIILFFFLGTPVLLAAPPLFGDIKAPRYLDVDKNYFDRNKSNFSLEGLKTFLSTQATKKAFHTSELNEKFKTPEYLTLEKLGGGKQTVQIFRITEKQKRGDLPEGYSPSSWILKETKRFKELKNLQILLKSPLVGFDSGKASRDKAFPAIAFPREFFTYKLNAKDHFMVIMDAAPGLPLSAVQDDKNLDQYASLVGEKLGALHKEFMHPSKTRILGPTLVHGDLHMDNIFVDLHDNNTDSGTVTLIDVETFMRSIKTPATPAVDIILLYGFSTAHLTPSQRKVKGSSISLKTWHDNFLKPFLAGYIKNWPKDQQVEVLKELKDFFLDPRTFLSIFKNRFLALDYGRYSYNVNKYVKPIFKALEKELTTP
jgi:tRNA A-37 threonylcarbamoyl transferase component Bud32